MSAILLGFGVILGLGALSAYTIGWLVRDAAWLEEIDRAEQRKGAQRDADS